MSGEPVLMVGGEPGTQRHLANILQRWGYTPMLARSPEEAFAAVEDTRFLFSLVDGEVARVYGVELFQQLRSWGRDPGPIVLLADPNATGQDPEPPALGADATLQKPIDPGALENAIQHALSGRGRPGPEASAGHAPATLEQEIALWRSPQMQRVLEIIQRAARVDVPVLILGETGTGKGVVARAIHHLSPRRGQPFVAVNCAAVPSEVLERELFGHERGGPTGVEHLRVGKLESADHGTIFLEQVGDLPPAAQAKLLRLMQDGESSRVGGEATVKADVRILSASSQDLDRAVGLGRFREDLYYRLNVIPIVVPPLRDRREEIPLLVHYFRERYAKAFHREGVTLPPAVMDHLTRHRYPGNVRELENIVKRMIVLNAPSLPESLMSGGKGDDPGSGSSGPGEAEPRSLKEIAREAARAAEREAIARALEQTGWNRVKAAKLLKISYRALLYKIKQAGLKEPGPARTTPTPEGEEGGNPLPRRERG